MTPSDLPPPIYGVAFCELLGLLVLVSRAAHGDFAMLTEEETRRSVFMYLGVLSLSMSP
jgi:hypothetical protein